MKEVLEVLQDYAPLAAWITAAVGGLLLCRAAWHLGTLFDIAGLLMWLGVHKKAKDVCAASGEAEDRGPAETERRPTRDRAAPGGAERPRCAIPQPPGWLSCTREAGHSGPCATKERECRFVSRGGTGYGCSMPVGHRGPHLCGPDGVVYRDGSQHAPTFSEAREVVAPGGEVLKANEHVRGATHDAQLRVSLTPWQTRLHDLAIQDERHRVARQLAKQLEDVVRRSDEDKRAAVEAERERMKGEVAASVASHVAQRLGEVLPQAVSLVLTVMGVETTAGQVAPLCEEVLAQIELGRILDESPNPVSQEMADSVQKDYEELRDKASKSGWDEARPGVVIGDDLVGVQEPGERAEVPPMADPIPQCDAVGAEPHCLRCERPKGHAGKHGADVSSANFPQSNEWVSWE